ncbi:MAG: hypothetical protein NHG36_20070 [Chromatiaceae bacterium]|nr:hypothetical protein [Candidatus Thioaporhodococcus sediminis]
MAILLDSSLPGVALPDGLRWSDEFDWTPLAQSTEYSLTGALIVERATRQAGRPITLIGGKDFVWITRANLIALKTLLDSDDTLRLTLHDNRTFDVIPAPEPLAAYALPRVLDSGYANPGDDDWYVIDTLKLITV